MVENTRTSRELYEQMLLVYPDRINPGALLVQCERQGLGHARSKAGHLVGRRAKVPPESHQICVARVVIALIDFPDFLGVAMPTRPENQGKGWTESDVAELHSFVAKDMTVEQIARELGRTVEAVRAKAADEGIALLPSTAEGDIDE